MMDRTKAGTNKVMEIQTLEGSKKFALLFPKPIDTSTSTGCSMCAKMGMVSKKVLSFSTQQYFLLWALLYQSRWEIITCRLQRKR